jgi:hypothetical protein
MNARVPDDERYPEAIKFKVSAGIWEQCESCNDYFIWDKLSDEYVRTQNESRGEYWGAPCFERVVVGWICPGCTHYNEM